MIVMLKFIFDVEPQSIIGEVFVKNDLYLEKTYKLPLFHPSDKSKLESCNFLVKENLIICLLLILVSQPT